MKYLLTIVLSVMLFAVCITTTTVHAQTDPTAVTNSKTRLEKIGKLSGFLTPGQGLYKDDHTFYYRFAQIVNAFLAMIGIIATVYVLYAGTRWITAAGNAEQVDEAKDTIKSAVIGIGVVFFSYIIVNFVIARIIEAVTS